MSNTIKLKRSSTAGATPTAGSLEYGELALNYTDGNLFFKTAANVVTLLASTRIANYSGNVTAGNLSTGGSLSVTGNANVGNLGATAVVATTLTGTLSTASQPNITSVGNLTSLTVTGTSTLTGNVTVANILVDTNKSVDVGNNRVMNVGYPIANTDAVTKSYVDSITSSGFTVQDDTANTTVVSAGDTLQLYGTANEVTVEITNTDQITFGLPDNVTIAGNASTGNVSGTIGTFTNVAGTLTTAAQPNVTSVGSLTALTVTGNASAGNLSTTGKVTATGNVSGSYFIGDGSFLTNLPSQQGNAITNGTSNVAITTSSGNVTVGINGTANTVVISPGSLFVNGVFATPKTITSNVQMAADSTAMVISPLTIGNGYSMSIPTSSTVYVWIPS